MLSLGISKERSTRRDPTGLQTMLSTWCCNRIIGGYCRAIAGYDETTTIDADPVVGDRSCKIEEAKVGTSRDEATKGAIGASVGVRCMILASSS